MTQPPRRRAPRITKETPKLRPCLAPDHFHQILCTKANRLCDAGRDAVRRLDPLYGSIGAPPGHQQHGIAVSA